MQTQTPQLPEELASNCNFDDYLLAMKINAIIRYLKEKESGENPEVKEIPLRDYSHTEAIAKLIPAVNELCRRVNAMGESTHSELKPTQCEMCQAVNELAPREAGEKAGYRKGVEATVDITRKAPSWSEAIQDIKKLIE